MRALRHRSWPGIGLAFRLAFRGLVRAPGTSFPAVGVLTLGLAAPVIFFSILAGALRPLPVPGGTRVIRMEVTQPATGGVPVPMMLRDLEELRGAGSLESVGAFRIVAGTLVDPQMGASRISAAFLTPEVLPLLRTGPVLGRIPLPEEAEVGLLLGFELWKGTFEGDPDVLGRPVSLNGEARVITGVLPDGFGFPLHQNVWVLFDVDSADEDPVEIVGRLAAGASLKAASV
ncbi:MAG: hypothetical protein E4G90_06200, partial [Gemmatimonadales bacterium]